MGDDISEEHTTTVIVGAGQSGLAMSRRLTDLSIDHVLLERGEIANSWRHERWDSLKLLTPNWLARLPGFSYDGEDPDGYMDMDGVVGFIRDYAESFDAPVRADTTVTSLSASDDGYRVDPCHGEQLVEGGEGILKVLHVLFGIPR